MRFVVDESVEIDRKFKDGFRKNKESFFKTPIFVSMKNDEFNVLDGVKRLRCLINEGLNDDLSLLTPCLMDCGSKPYSDYERAKIKHFELLNELEEFLDDDEVYYFFANLKRVKRVKRAEIFLDFLDFPNLLENLKTIRKNNNPLVGFLYYINVFNSKMITDAYPKTKIFQAFLDNDEKIKNILKCRLNHYKLDELKYHDTSTKIKNILTLFNMIKDDKSFNYKEFKTTKYDLEHIKARKVKEGNKDKWKNKLCNMLLLDLSTNRAYSNASFNKKAEFIKKNLDKKYYLYATRAVFVDKTYGDIWDESAAKNYLEDIKTTLDFIWSE